MPVGFTEELKADAGTDAIVFSPEFLREGKALHDCLHPSRIVVGEDSARGRQWPICCAIAASARRAGAADRQHRPRRLLFANTFLLMRVAFFNDWTPTPPARLARQIIDGVCLTRASARTTTIPPGYGGYCLPKDTRQLLAITSAYRRA